MTHRAQSRLILSELQVHTKQLRDLKPSVTAPKSDLKSKDDDFQPTLPQIVSKGLQELCDQTDSGGARSVLEFLCNASQNTENLQLNHEQTGISDYVVLPSTQLFNEFEAPPPNQADRSNQLVYPALTRRLGPSAFKKTISWRLSVYRFPIGTLTVERSRKQKGDDSAENQEYHVYFSLYPPTWLATRAIKFSLSLGGEFAAPVCTIKSEMYNSDPRLLQAINSGEIGQLKALFFEGVARPTDIIAPWGNTLLHVSSKIIANLIVHEVN